MEIHIKNDQFPKEVFSECMLYRPSDFDSSVTGDIYDFIWR